MKAYEYDICLVSPPLIESVPTPPAGVPSLVAYLKQEGYSSLVLDLDLLYKKTIGAYKIFSFLESKLLSLRHSGLNSPLSQNNVESKSKNISLKGRSKKLFKRIGKYLLKKVRKFKNSSFKIQSHSLESIFEMLSSDVDFTDIENRLKLILEEKVKGVKIFGISVTYPDQVLYSLLTARLIKKINKDIFIVLGGAQTTTYIDKFKNESALVNFVDAFIVHEGEEGLTALVDAIKTNKDFSTIPNLYYKENNEFKASKKVDYVMPLSQYATPDFDGFDLSDYPEEMLPIRTLRGCYWGKCTFCSYSHTGGKFRGFTDIDFVINSVKTLQKKYNMHRFEFIDDSIPATFLKKLAPAIIENKLNIEWFTRANVQEDFKDVEFVKLLRKSGCAALYFGVESGNERIMKLMKKMQVGKPSVEKVMETVNAQNIQPVTYMMFGFPTETKKEIEESLDFFMKLKKQYNCAINSASVFNLVPGTAVFDNPEEYKITKVYTNTKKASQGYGFEYDISEGLSRKEVYKYANRVNLYLKYPFLYDINKRFFANA